MRQRPGFPILLAHIIYITEIFLDFSAAVILYKFSADFSSSPCPLPPRKLKPEGPVPDWTSSQDPSSRLPPQQTDCLLRTRRSPGSYNIPIYTVLPQYIPNRGVLPQYIPNYIVNLTAHFESSCSVSPPLQ